MEAEHRLAAVGEWIEVTANRYVNGFWGMKMLYPVKGHTTLWIYYSQWMAHNLRKWMGKYSKLNSHCWGFIKWCLNQAMWWHIHVIPVYWVRGKRIKSSRPFWATQNVHDHPGLEELLSLKTNKQINGLPCYVSMDISQKMLKRSYYMTAISFLCIYYRNICKAMSITVLALHNSEVTGWALVNGNGNAVCGHNVILFTYREWIIAFAGKWMEMLDVL